ncbi:GvpL/GvpF family gas vesicle protein [Georgenia thermotolerans]|uniref:GvpL 2 n=1 Tax=Georgenia thermotolerans TaxID=527326 RepID=A0A7J5UPQ0_9MICO|nr:GvpL/GvpF family gas vesicle protein [Georgenia thermotolerans]KAE8763913.1 gvpL 2 [Georgenia thermotolerans]
MSGLYVYAIVPADMPPTQLGTGIDRAPLELVVAPGGVAAVVHEHAGNPYDGADEDVRRWVLEHGDVVERVFDAAGTVLPVSFNVIVAASDDAPARDRLRDWLGRGSSQLGGRLERLRGRVELRVEIALDPHDAAAGHPDARSLLAELGSRPAGVQRLLRKRLEQLEKEVTDALADELYPEYRRRLAALAEEITENRSARTDPGTVAVLTVAVLVAREDMPRVGEALADIQREQSAARIRYLGPWPPYSFADVPALTPGQEGA